MIYDNGWFRISSVNKCGRKSAHYFFNDKPLHMISSGLYKETIDFSNRHVSEGRKCKTCQNILTAYSKIGIANRCTA